MSQAMLAWSSEPCCSLLLGPVASKVPSSPTESPWAQQIRATAQGLPGLLGPTWPPSQKWVLELGREQCEGAGQQQAAGARQLESKQQTSGKSGSGRTKFSLVFSESRAGASLPEEQGNSNLAEHWLTQAWQAWPSNSDQAVPLGEEDRYRLWAKGKCTSNENKTKELGDG